MPLVQIVTIWGIRQNASAIKSLYNNVNCWVKLDTHTLTKEFPVHIGVKQGCKLSPTLFNIYINDLAIQIKNLNKGVKVGNDQVSILLYADDLVLLSDSARNLQSQLDCLNNWCQTWRMDINVEKTKVVHFRNKSVRATRYPFKCDEKCIGMTSKYKYLGLWFNEHLDMSDSAKEIAKSATRALGVIIAKFKQLGGISYTCFKKLYESSVEPILLYGAGVWGSKEFRILNTVQNKAARFILGVQPKACNTATQGDLGWISVFGKQKLEVIRLWTRLNMMSEDRTTSKVFKQNCNKALNGVINWENSVMQLLKDLDHSLVDLHQVNLKDVKVKLLETEQRNWLNKLWNDNNNEHGNKLRSYRQYKDTLEVEDYVKINVPWYVKSVFAKLRAGCLNLEIETGRFKRPQTPLEHRVCKLCHKNVIEDEHHFIMCCPLYDNLRDELFNHCANEYVDFKNCNESEKFIYIMKRGDLFIVKQIFKMYNRRCCFV